MTEAVLQQILAELKRQTGVDLSSYRKETLVRRLGNRMATLGVQDEHKYLSILLENPFEGANLVNSVTVQVSSFFRDPLVYEYLAERVLPSLRESKKQQGIRSFRVWSAGTANGEEAYSLGILLNELTREEDDEWSVAVYATDISDKALTAARSGVFQEKRLEEVKLRLFNRYFTHLGNGSYKISPSIQRFVEFSHDDIAAATLSAPRESVFGAFDIILCRNVLIYFDAPTQSTILNRFLNTLEPGGYLVLGESETLPPQCYDYLEVVDPFCKIYRKNKSVQRG